MLWHAAHVLMKSACPGRPVASPMLTLFEATLAVSDAIFLTLPA
jgi:hypothetical protein